MTSFEATNFLFNVTDENKSFSNTTPSFWTPEDGEEVINNLNELLELRSENHIELHVKKFEKRGTRIEIENSVYNLAGFVHFKSEILAELKRVIYKDLQDIVYRMGLTYDEMVNMLDVKYITGSTRAHTLKPGIY